MPIPELVTTYLERHHMASRIHHHSKVFTARELASVENLKGNQVAKTVFFYIDGKMAMGVLPADRHLCPTLLRDLTGARKVRLAHEFEIAVAVRTLQPGAIPPFGSLFGLPVYLDEILMVQRTIEVPGGVHSKSISLLIPDYVREEMPIVMALSRTQMHDGPHCHFSHSKEAGA